MNPYADFDSWLIRGSRWTLCRVVSRDLRGLATVLLYDGMTKATGRARRGLRGWLVEAA